MAQMLSLARLHFVVLAIFTVGRWLMGTSGVPYDKGHHIFSIVIFTWTAAFFYGAFCRRWLGFRAPQAMALAMLLALTSQVVVLLAMLLSYALGLDTYFNHPRALNAPELLPLGRALQIRLGGLVTNTILSAIIGALGWALGALLPVARPAEVR